MLCLLGSLPPVALSANRCATTFSELFHGTFFSQRLRNREEQKCGGPRRKSGREGANLTPPRFKRMTSRGDVTTGDESRSLAWGNE